MSQVPQTERSDWKAWLPVVALSFASFIFVTTEFLPLGLVTDIAEDLGTSVPTTNYLVSGYAWVVALMSLPLTGLVARIDRKVLLLTLLGIFVAAHIVAGFAHSFEMLAASRLGIALAHAVFWAITTPLAARLAPGGKKAYGLAIIVVGTSLASILGIPIGTMLGKVFHWQTAFMIVAAVAALIFCALAVMLPRLPAVNSGSLKNLPHLLGRKPLMLCYLLTMLAITGEFMAFAYIEPFSKFVSGFSEKTVIYLLFSFGAAGIIGGFLNARATPLFPRTIIFGSFTLVVLCLLSLHVAAPYLPAMLLLCLVWGACMTLILLTLQLRVMALATDATDIAMALFSAIFNVGIGLGTFLGGRVVLGGHLRLEIGATAIDLRSYELIGYGGAVFMAAALVVAVPALWKGLKKPPKPAAGEAAETPG